MTSLYYQMHSALDDTCALNGALLNTMHLWSMMHLWTGSMSQLKCKNSARQWRMSAGCQLGRAICISLHCHRTNEDIRGVKLTVGIWKSETKQIVINVKACRLGLSVLVCVWPRNPHLHSGWHFTAVLSSVNLSEWISPFISPHHSSYVVRGGERQTNQKMVSLIHSHVNR